MPALLCLLFRFPSSEETLARIAGKDSPFLPKNETSFRMWQQLTGRFSSRAYLRLMISAFRVERGAILPAARRMNSTNGTTSGSVLFARAVIVVLTIAGIASAQAPDVGKNVKNRSL